MKTRFANAIEAGVNLGGATSYNSTFMPLWFQFMLPGIDASFCSWVNYSKHKVHKVQKFVLSLLFCLTIREFITLSKIFKLIKIKFFIILFFNYSILDNNVSHSHVSNQVFHLQQQKTRKQGIRSPSSKPWLLQPVRCWGKAQPHGLGNPDLTLGPT